MLFNHNVIQKAPQKVSQKVPQKRLIEALYEICEKRLKFWYDRFDRSSHFLLVNHEQNKSIVNLGHFQKCDKWIQAPAWAEDKINL